VTRSPGVLRGGARYPDAVRNAGVGRAFFRAWHAGDELPLERLAWLLPLLAAWAITADTGGDAVAGIGYPILWLAATSIAVSGVSLERVRGRRVPSAADVLGCEAVCAMVLSAAVTAQSPLLRDLDIYLRAGRHFLDGAPVYATSAITVYPADLGTLPFLYPPPVLPVFGALALMPAAVASIAWFGASVLAAVVALRRFGLSWRWIALLFAWTPLTQGLYVGNAAVPALLLLAFAPAAGGLLVASALLKPQSGLLGLWLVRERRWRGLLLGLGGGIAIVAATLPLTGTGLWSRWLGGLDAYAASQRIVPGLYGFALPRYLPWPVPLVLGIGATVLALRWSGSRGLGRLAWASAVASPSLWAHGFLVVIPELFASGATWLWLGLALTSSVRGPGWALALAIPPTAWAVASRRHAGSPAGVPASHPRLSGDDWQLRRAGGRDAGIRPAPLDESLARGLRDAG